MDKVEQMKRIIFLLAMLLIAFGLQAQKGVFDISYGDPWPKADSLLAEYNFFARDIDGAMVKYYCRNIDPMVEAVILYIEPTHKTVVGWFVKHWHYLESEDVEIIVNRLVEIHGEPTHYDQETDQLIWVFTPDRTVHVLYVSDDSFCVFYKDSQHQDLFTVSLDKYLEEDLEGIVDEESVEPEME